MVLQRVASLALVLVGVLLGLLTGEAQTPPAFGGSSKPKVLRANVRSDGQLAEGSRSTSSERDGTGTYLVTFARDVSKCTPVASAGGGESGSSSYFATFGTARSPSGDKHTAFVQFRGSSLAWIDTAFHLIVACSEAARCPSPSRSIA